MRRIGILSFSSPGHFYPLTALGRRLQSRGHEVVYFQVADLEQPIRAAGLEFRQIGRDDFPLGSLRARDEELGQLEGLAALRCALRGIGLKTMMLFRDAPAAIRDEGVDSLIVDQIEIGGRDRGRTPGPAVRQRGGRPAGQPRPQRPARHLPVVPPHRRRGPAPEPGGQRGLRVDLLGGPADDQPAAPGLGAAPGPGLQRAVLRARPGRATARRPGAAGPPPAAPLPPHRPLDGRGGAGAGGLPLVPPRPRPAPGIRLDGDAPERGPPDVPDDRRGVRGAGPATGDLAGRRAGSGAARGPSRRSDRGRVRAAARADPAVRP